MRSWAWLVCELVGVGYAIASMFISRQARRARRDSDRLFERGRAEFADDPASALAHCQAAEAIQLHGVLLRLRAFRCSLLGCALVVVAFVWRFV